MPSTTQDAVIQASGQDDAQIVTPQMLESALEGLRDSHLGDDLRDLAERVYLAMHYVRFPASVTNPER
jgi:hypothetical protein